MSIFQPHVSYTMSALCKSGLFGFAALLWFDSLITFPCGSKRVAVFSVILWCRYIRKKFVHFVGLVSRIGRVYIEGWFKPIFPVFLSGLYKLPNTHGRFVPPPPVLLKLRHRSLLGRLVAGMLPRKPLAVDVSICGRESGTVTGFSPSTSVSFRQYHSVNTPHSFKHRRCYTVLGNNSVIK